MANWNFCEDPYPGPDYLESSLDRFKSRYLSRSRQYFNGMFNESQYIDEYEQYFLSPPAVSWSSAAADPLKDLRDAMVKFGASAPEVTARVKEFQAAFIPLTIDMPKYQTADGKPKQRTRGPRIDFGFDRRGRKVR